jgi:hypothetical protein
VEPNRALVKCLTKSNDPPHKKKVKRSPITKFTIKYISITNIFEDTKVGIVSERENI